MDIARVDTSKRPADVRAAVSRRIVPTKDRVRSLLDKLRNMPDFTEPEGDTFVITAGPTDIVKDGEVVGYEVWVKHFDAEGYELPIDPHRQFLYPPDGSYLDEQGTLVREIPIADVVRGMISRTVRATPGRVS